MISQSRIVMMKLIFIPSSILKHSYKWSLIQIICNIQYSSLHLQLNQNYKHNFTNIKNLSSILKTHQNHLSHTHFKIFIKIISILKNIQPNHTFQGQLFIIIQMKIILFTLLLLITNTLDINLVCEAYTPSICLSCVPGYYLFYPVTPTTQCQRCSDAFIGCLTCQTIQKKDNITITQVSCTQCREGYDLVNNSTTNQSFCISCPQGKYYQITTMTFKNCSASNCKRCPEYQLSKYTGLICKQCNDGYYYDFSSNSCSLQTKPDFSAVTDFTNITYAYYAKQFILHQLPIFRVPVYNFQTLSKVCPNNGFGCLCVNLNNTTSRCSFINRSDTSLMSVYNYSDKLGLSQLVQLELYNLAIQTIIDNQNKTDAVLTKMDLLLKTATSATTDSSRSSLRNILEIISKLKHTNGTLSKIGNIITSIVLNIAQLNFFKTSDAGSNIFTGNQYVFKVSKYNNTQSINSSSYSVYTPFQATYNNPSSGIDYQFMIFNRSVFNDSFTGYLFTGNNFTTNPFNLTIPYLSSIAPVNTYQLAYTNGSALGGPSSVSLSNGLFKLINLPSNSSSVWTITTTAVPSSINNYDSLRIQKLFYQFAIFFILFFLLLYMIFIPLCTFYDMCKDPKSKRNKRYVIKQVGTLEQIRVPEENIPPVEQNDDDNEINYKQFFPIYNVGATQNRPERLLKLCLYLLNLQNHITYLVLLYSGIPKSVTDHKEVWAIVLAIPAYFLSIITGYIFGLMKKYIHGRWKWCLNIIVIGYWILWFFLMREFDKEVSLCVIIFAIVLTLIDLIVDAVQCLIMYLIIKGQNPIYNCMAPLFAARGYFDYDKYQPV